VLTLGAGNVYQAGDQLLRILEEEQRSGGAEGQRSVGEV
jgi:hypothetical protein